MSGLELRYFILKPRGNSPGAFASRMAMIAYADAIEKDEPQLAEELRNWAKSESARVTLGLYDHDLGGPQV